MRRLARSRLTQLERRMNVDGLPIGRLLFLIPDLWPAEDQAAFRDPANTEALGDLVERRTGVRLTFGMVPPVWAIVLPASEEMLALDAAGQVAFLERHETRPLTWWQRREHA